MILDHLTSSVFLSGVFGRIGASIIVLLHQKTMAPGLRE